MTKAEFLYGYEFKVSNMFGEVYEYHSDTECVMTCCKITGHEPINPVRVIHVEDEGFYVDGEFDESQGKDQVFVRFSGCRILTT
ncbi:hypothetical protein SAMN05192574_101369 [Mucilaginibacter gossypiicola]|uniref:Uncharacterized protein n=1 Tax=Mucilaginibacter gossypiicola TaxID=551995 RepID=A0A1H8A4V1_9SPHI|nr:hypothetical protein [Mucilaginibacter gossypiicola]SEM65932.1 hypothetical protein SAMN05192574_101369 [Mucilaginibacter gossypiicola]